MSPPEGAERPMHVAIIGAGALGRIYGVRLANAGDDVSFVLRPARRDDSTPMSIEVVGCGRGPEVLARPKRVAEVPPSTQIVVVTVRFEQLATPELTKRLLRVAAVPIVVLTPMFPAQHAALTARVGERVVAAMPGAVGYLDERGVVRTWLPAYPPTLLDDLQTSEHSTGSVQLARTVEGFAQRLRRAELPARIAVDVVRTNAASTIAFFPLIAAIAVADGLDRLAQDDKLLERTRRALAESHALARRVGAVAPWARAIVGLARPSVLRGVVALGQALVPEPLRFLDQHFGAKLADQHVEMAGAIAEIAREHGVTLEALPQLVGKLGTSAARRVPAEHDER